MKYDCMLCQSEVEVLLSTAIVKINKQFIATESSSSNNNILSNKCTLVKCILLHIYNHQDVSVVLAIVNRVSYIILINYTIKC
jgi:hypothetical protein